MNNFTDYTKSNFWQYYLRNKQTNFKDIIEDPNFKFYQIPKIGTHQYDVQVPVKLGGQQMTLGSLREHFITRMIQKQLAFAGKIKLVPRAPKVIIETQETTKSMTNITSYTVEFNTQNQSLKSVIKMLFNTYNPDHKVCNIKLAVVGNREDLSFFSTYMTDDLNKLLDNVDDTKNMIEARYDSCEIKRVTLNVYTHFKIPCMIGQGGKTKDAKLPDFGTAFLFKDKYLVYNPKAKTNCLYQAYEAFNNPAGIYTDQIMKSAKKLKQSIKNKYGLTSDKYSTDVEVEKISEYKDCTIVVHDIDFNEIYRSNHGTKITNLIYHKNHYYAMLPPDTKTAEPKFSDKKVIKRFFNPKTFNKNFGACDLEAFTDSNGNFIAYASNVAFKFGDEIFYHSWVGHEDCLKKLFKYLFNQTLISAIYFHNGGKFDMNIIFDQLLKEKNEYYVVNEKLVDLNGRLTKVVVNDDISGRSIRFLDSYCLFNASLENITGPKGFDVPHKKLVGNLKHKDVNINNYREIMKTEEAIKYFENDTLGLLECLIKFAEDLEVNEGIDMTSNISASSCAKKIFLGTYYKKYKYPINKLDKDVDKFIRNSYHGGRNEAFKIGSFDGPLYYYDFTSLYPDVGRMQLPYGDPMKIKCDIFKWEKKELLRFLNNNSSFIKCNVRSKLNVKIPLLPCYTDCKLLFPHFENWTEQTYTGIEIAKAIEGDLYEFEFIEGYFFKQAPFLEELFEHLFQKKAQAKKDGKTTLALMYKIIANSSYGFWALRTDNRDSVAVIKDDNDVFDLYINGRLKELYQFGDNYFCRYTQDLEDCDRNIAIASYICAYARCKLYSLMTSVMEKGYDVYYCDTDSVITNCNLSEYPDLMGKFCPDGTGDALGSLKNEITDKMSTKKKDEIKELEKELERKLTVDELRSLDDKYNRDTIDRLIVVGNKTYYWETRLNNSNKVVSDSKFKGFSMKQNSEVPEEWNNRKLTAVDYIDYLNGIEIKQTVDQFLSKKSEKQQQFMMLRQQEKCFKFQYNKRVLVQTNELQWDTEPLSI